MSAADSTLAYVVASADLLGLHLDEARALRVAAHLQRTAGMARLLESMPLAPEDEIAEIYCPAPFPAAPSAASAHSATAAP